MAVLSGKDGTVNWNGSLLSQITQWQCTETCHISAWASNSTGGYKHRVAGVKDWSGTFSGKYDGGIAAAVGQGSATGTPVSLVLGIADGESLSGDAIIESLELLVDIDNGDVVGYQARFSGNGALSRS